MIYNNIFFQLLIKLIQIIHNVHYLYSKILLILDY